MGRHRNGYEDFTILGWRIARRRDTLHLLVLLLRAQAVQRGDTTTISLIDATLTRIDEGDPIKRDLIGVIRLLS